MSREKAKKHRVVRATERPLSVSNENRIGCWYKLAFALVGDRAAKNKVGVKVSVKGKGHLYPAILLAWIVTLRRLKKDIPFVLHGSWSTDFKFV